MGAGPRVERALNQLWASWGMRKEDLHFETLIPLLVSTVRARLAEASTPAGEDVQLSTLARALQLAGVYLVRKDM